MTLNLRDPRPMYMSCTASGRNGTGGFIAAIVKLSDRSILYKTTNSVGVIGMESNCRSVYLHQLLIPVNNLLPDQKAERKMRFTAPLQVVLNLAMMTTWFLASPVHATFIVSSHSGNVPVLNCQYVEEAWDLCGEHACPGQWQEIE